MNGTCKPESNQTHWETELPELLKTSSLVGSALGSRIHVNARAGGIVAEETEFAVHFLSEIK